MQYKFNKHLQNLLPDRALKILVAVSGGADSMCLLDLLWNCGLDLTISVAHMNFCLRGAESDADEALVRRWAADHGIGIFVKKVDTVGYAEKKSISIEMAARDLRYDWFYALTREHGFDYIALAHHANDNAETLMLNLLRGCGIRGVCGMKMLDAERKLLRPLLLYTRAQIDKYVEKRGIPFHTDRTNADVEFHRNRIRNIIVPEFEKINPHAVVTLNRDMGYFSAAAEILSELKQKKAQEILCRTDGGDYPFLSLIKNSNARNFVSMKSVKRVICTLDITRLQADSHSGFWLYEFLSEFGFNSSQIEDISANLSNTETKRITNGEYTAIKERGYIKIYNHVAEKEFAGPIIIDEFDTPFLVSAYGCRIVLSIEESAGAGSSADLIQTGNDNGILLTLSADELRFPLLLRKIEAGDKWRPFGLKGFKKVSDYLTDIKMDSLLKEEVLVLCDSADTNNPGNIICLPGLEISDLYKVRKTSKKLLRIRFI